MSHTVSQDVGHFLPLRRSENKHPADCYKHKLFPDSEVDSSLESYQYLQQLLEVAGDEGVVFVKRPAALLGVVPVTGEVAEDHLQPLFIVTHLALRQRSTQILQRQRTPGQTQFVL